MSALNIENVVQVVKIFLNSRNMLAYESWISGCVEYFILQSQSLTEIKNNAYQQWLLNDLKYICPGSLPENLANLNKIELKGNFVLQINSAIDISTPKYQQYLKMKKTDTQNIEATMNPEEKISSKRMLKFELTDGQQTIAGMEYETIKVSSEDIIPGCKAIIKGPVSCRLGMLLLSDKTMELLGGESQSLLKTHSLAAQLASSLNLPLIDKIPLDITVIPQTNNRVVSSNTSQTSTSIQNRTIQNNVVDRQTPNSHQSVSSSTIRTNSYNGHSDNAATDSHSFGKRQLEAKQVPEKRMKFDEEINFDEYDWETFEEDIRVIEEVEQLHQSIHDNAEDVKLQLHQSIHDNAEDVKLEEEVLKTIEEFEQLHSAQNSQATLPTEPFVYIKQINELSESEKSGKVFRVKAQIQNVLTKLTMTPKREWNLKCTIIDGTGCMDVEFSSDILSDLLGYTPESISEIKKKVATNPGIKNEINLAYVKTAETLRTLYCIMELTMYTLPKITKLIDYAESHIQLLKKRLKCRIKD